jgi:mercuric ion transport protein
MAAKSTTNTTSHVRGVMTYFMGGITLLTCPCHLPILLLLLSGTAAGAFLSENLGLAVLVLLPIFLLSALATWRLLDTSKNDRRQIPHHRSG